jgi:hypothetical protein
VKCDRDGLGGYYEEMWDSQAAYTQALLWWYTGDETYAQRAVRILNAYSSVLMDHIGVDAPLFAAWAAQYFARAAEILRYTYTPSAGYANFNQTSFTRMLNDAFLDIVRNDSGCKYGAGWWNPYNSNWDLAAIDALASIAVYKNDGVQFQVALDRWRARIRQNIYHSSDGSRPISSPFIHNYYSEQCVWIYNRVSACSNSTTAQTVSPFYENGQNVESCRDWPHAGLSLAAMANTAETAWIQGFDLYRTERIRLMTGFSYAVQMLLYYDLNNTYPSQFCSPAPMSSLIGTATDPDGPLGPRNNGGRQLTASEVAYNAYVIRGGETRFQEIAIPNYSSAGIAMYQTTAGADPLRTIIDKFRGNQGQLTEDYNAHISLWETLTHHRVGDGGKLKYLEAFFGDGTLNGWTAQGGAWTNPSTYVRGVSTTGNTWLKSSAPAQSNFKYTAFVKIYTGTGLGLSFRTSPTIGSTGYEAIIDKGANHLKLIKRPYTLLATYPFTVSLNKWYKLDIRANGSSIKVLLDGIERINVTDSSYASGQFALFTYNSESHFDEVIVSGL